jgi:hypothetical protein
VFFSRKSKLWDISVPKIFVLFLFCAATAGASLCLNVPRSFASAGDAPWCIISDEGNLHCYYATSQACLAEIAAGNRGFCTQNPAGGAETSAPSQQAARRRK